MTCGLLWRRSPNLREYYDGILEGTARAFPARAIPPISLAKLGGQAREAGRSGRPLFDSRRSEQDNGSQQIQSGERFAHCLVFSLGFSGVRVQNRRGADTGRARRAIVTEAEQ